MNKVFAIEICNKDREVELQLPATDYQLLDVMEKLGIIEEVKPSVSIYQYGEGFENLADVLDHNNLDLFELNALARRLFQFELEDLIAFHSLVITRLEQREDDISVRELLDFSHSTDCCEVRPGIETFEELGHFYVENDLIPELKGIPDKSLPFLDYKAVGKKFSEAECGTLVPGGYVTQSSEIKEVAKNMTFAPPVPNYTILMQLEREGMSVKLPLPAQSVGIDSALRAVNSFGWSDPLLQVTCLDCAAPSLIPILGGRDDPDKLNQLAWLIDKMGPKQLTKFKAVLDAVEDWSLPGAIKVAHHLDDYLFSPNITDPELMAMDFLSSSVGESPMDTLLKFVNLYGLGQTLIEEQKCAVTDYGLISREDGQHPSILERHSSPLQRGMEEMTM